MLKNKIIYLIIFITLFLTGVPCFNLNAQEASTVTLTEEEYNKVIARLEQDKRIISTDEIRWHRLKTSEPKITYNIEEDQVIIQTVEIPIYNASPLIYQVKFTVKINEVTPVYFPWTLMLCGMLETASLTDFKLGVTVLSFEPIKYKVITNMRLNALIGIKSAGASVSYYLPKPFKNTAMHLYVGSTYTLKATYGIGISLNF